MKSTSNKPSTRTTLDRRSILRAASATCAIAPVAPWLPQFGASRTGSLTKEQRDSMTPAQIIEQLKKGNVRFRTGQMIARSYSTEQRSSAAGQYPAAVVLGCIDSRVPAEIVFDAGIGDLFNARIAGNVVDDGLLGSMEFACAVAGAKAVLLLGHTACGAIKGAIDDVVLGNLTGVLAQIKPAVRATQFAGERSSKSTEYVDAVARTNVLVGLGQIRRRSPVLEDLEKKGTVGIVGAIYDLSTGAVEFLPDHNSSQ